MSAAASATFGSSSVAPSASSRNSGPSSAADDGSTDTLMPAATARAIAASAAGRGPGRTSE